MSVESNLAMPPLVDDTQYVMSWHLVASWPPYLWLRATATPANHVHNCPSTTETATLSTLYFRIILQINIHFSPGSPAIQKHACEVNWNSKLPTGACVSVNGCLSWSFYVTLWWTDVTCVTLALPHDSLDRLQQTPVILSAGGSGYRRWMDGLICNKKTKQSEFTNK